MSDRTYISIDLKSFYASVECVKRKLNPLTTHLVVADVTRTEKTICLAVSPSLKAYGISGRARLFEVEEKVRNINQERKKQAVGHKLQGTSWDEKELSENFNLQAIYIAAPPRMAEYMRVSTQIYHIYLNYIAPEDIHVYSVDEVMMDVTAYLQTYKMSAHQLAQTMIRDVFHQTGITATAGIGSNLYLAKVAMDIVAKHTDPDEDGVRIAELTEETYRERLWAHRPITDFWRVGKGYARKLKEYHMETMGDVARCSLGTEQEFYNEELLYRLFGINAELLIDHAWGYEPCTISDIKAYQPRSTSHGSGQVLSYPYEFTKARVSVLEMADALALELVEQKLVTNKIVLNVGYDISNLTDDIKARNYNGPIVIDEYGRKIPKAAHGTAHLEEMTSSSKLITKAVLTLYDNIVNPQLLIRRIYVTAEQVESEEQVLKNENFHQLDLFADILCNNHEKKDEEEREREKKIQMAVLDIKKKFGKNAILKGTSLQEGATAKDRNERIGGHKA